MSLKSKDGDISMFNTGNEDSNNLNSGEEQDSDKDKRSDGKSYPKKRGDQVKSQVDGEDKDGEDQDQDKNDVKSDEDKGKDGDDKDGDSPALDAAVPPAPEGQRKRSILSDSISVGRNNDGHNAPAANTTANTTADTKSTTNAPVANTTANTNAPANATANTNVNANANANTNAPAANTNVNTTAPAANANTNVNANTNTNAPAANTNVNTTAPAANANTNAPAANTNVNTTANPNTNTKFREFEKKLQEMEKQIKDVQEMTKAPNFDKDKKFPQDSYSFLVPINGASAPDYSTHAFMFRFFGIAVFFIQTAFFISMMWSVINPKTGTTEETDNPFDGFGKIIPANAKRLLKWTQVLSLLTYVIIPDSSMIDVVNSILFSPFTGGKNADEPVGWMRFACALKALQGIVAIITTLFLVLVSGTKVIDVILNFSAMAFVSELDERAFILAESGAFGPALRKQAETIKKKDLPDGMHSNQYKESTVYRAVMSLIGLGFIVTLAWIFINQNSRNKWVTETFSLEFADSQFADYSGCFEIKNKVRSSNRFIYQRSGNHSFQASIGYCKDDRKWRYFDGNDPCDTTSSFLGSVKTDDFDVSTSFEDVWYNSGGEIVHVNYYNDCECFSKKLDMHVNVFPLDIDPAVKWLHEDRSGNSNCGDESFVERYALVQMNFEMDYSFISTENFCLWIPIECRRDKVIKLNLPYSNTNATGIPSEIGLLKELEVLVLDGTSLFTLEGSFQNFTQFLPNMTNLSNLTISGSLNGSLNGTIPTEFGLMTSLNHLELNENKLTGTIPTEFGLMTSLNYLNLKRSSLNGTIPTEFGLMTSLNHLDLYYNELTGTIPTEFGLMTSLTYLDLERNYLTGTIPTEFDLMASLNDLNLEKKYDGTNNFTKT